jgi:hypothetical protein
MPAVLTWDFPLTKRSSEMATRQIKMPRKDGSENEIDEAPSQRKRPESGRYLLQVDRQTKGSYLTAEAAQSAALVIKKGYPVVQVSVYDRVGSTNTLVELPVASSWPFAYRKSRESQAPCHRNLEFCFSS